MTVNASISTVTFLLSSLPSSAGSWALHGGRRSSPWSVGSEFFLVFVRLWFIALFLGWASYFPETLVQNAGDESFVELSSSGAQWSNSWADRDIIREGVGRWGKWVDLFLRHVQGQGRVGWYSQAVVFRRVHWPTKVSIHYVMLVSINHV